MMTAVFALFEIILTNTLPPPLLHLPFLILILLLYVSLAYVTRAAEGFYVYSFLDPGVHGSQSGHVAAYLFGIFAVILVIFGVVWFLIWLRRRIVGNRVKWAKGAVERQHGGEAGDLADEKI
jgi:predicted membrane protein